MPNFWDRLTNVWTNNLQYPGWQAKRTQPARLPNYDTLRAYYDNNGLYSDVQNAAKSSGVWIETMRPIRNPANAAVEFYASTVWPGSLPGALPIVTANERIVDPIYQVWGWSNWGARKQVAIRWLSIYGDGFIKIAQRDNKVFLQLIDPQHVSEFECDERGYLTYIRIDIPQVAHGNNMEMQYTHTEVWTKDGFSEWRHQGGAMASLETMGNPISTAPIEAFGIDFIPIVHYRFRDVGDERGAGCFSHALDTIDESNRQATRLHQMLFRYNKPIWALAANGTDSAGRPLPPPAINTSAGRAADTLELGDDSLIRLPGNASLDSLIPQLAWGDALNILQAQIEYLGKYHLPELAWYDVVAQSQISGRAIRMMLNAAISRCLEARGNAEAALARADSIALTLGSMAGLFGDIGNYAAGDFEHSFAERDVVPVDGLEQAQEANTWVQAGVPTAVAVEWSGKTDEQADEIAEGRAEENEQGQTRLAQALLEARRNFDQGAE